MMTEFETHMLDVLRAIRDQLADTSGYLEDLKAEVSKNHEGLTDSMATGMNLYERQSTGLISVLERIEVALER
ncbi:hypothetical protein E2E30_03070 [Sphingomonas sp. AAP5]|nr:hypothetical protein E2E30_03070 [Sphingomonas sp. AAP5]